MTANYGATSNVEFRATDGISEAETGKHPYGGLVQILKEPIHNWNQNTLVGQNTEKANKSIT